MNVEKIEMVVSKRKLCERIVKPFIHVNMVFIGGLLILFLVVSLFSQGSFSFLELIGLSFMGVMPTTIGLGPFIATNLIRGLKYIGEQEKFYEIEFDQDVKNIMMEKPIYEGLYWYIDVDRFRLVVFRNGFITAFEKYKKVGNRGRRAYVTALCADGKKRRLSGSVSSIARLRKWVGRCRKQDKTSS